MTDATFRLEDPVSGVKQSVLYDQAHILVIVNDEQLCPHDVYPATPWSQMRPWVQIPIDVLPSQ
jgi:hypothetical protein